ncbi:hypothetical protein V2J09_012560, partial [Rumex salicifolius]
LLQCFEPVWRLSTLSLLVAGVQSSGFRSLVLYPSAFVLYPELGGFVAMFSITAINDTTSKGEWEPLAPTKEAQEFYLTQTYHDGLLKLEANEYEKARELLETVLKDPLISNAQVDSATGDSHLLQLRFLALKNLASVFLQQGSSHYEGALNCYLQAVEIDTKDSVIWNKLGTLSCSMGLLSISRWAFEQGNCMEKLLEVLIAIGDEVASLSVAELILQQWPSHFRAMHVKRTIEESEPVPFAPRGIDKLEPKHDHLKFANKRVATNNSEGENIVQKRLKKSIELDLEEVSWSSLADSILGILHASSRCSSKEEGTQFYKSGDIRIEIKFPANLESGKSVEKKSPSSNTVHNETVSTELCNTANVTSVNRKEGFILEEKTHERRSTRLESLRSSKPGKEDSQHAGNKDAAKLVAQFLEPFIVSDQNKDFDHTFNFTLSSCNGVGNSLDEEQFHVIQFVKETSSNYGAYHLGHLLLEKAAKGLFSYQESFVKFLELEKLTRNWGIDRIPECSLFLAELYYDLASCSSDASSVSDCLLNVTYHICKIIESVALDTTSSGVSENRSFSLAINDCQNSVNGSSNALICLESSLHASIITEKSSFWVRYYWLSGHASAWDGNKEKAHEEFSIALFLLENNKNLNDIPGAIHLPHCKVSKELSVDRILHEINLLEVHFLMKKTVGEMIKNEMYSECIDVLGPLLLSTKGVHLDTLLFLDKGEEHTLVELSALDALIKACENSVPVNLELCLNCHRRKLQILMKTSSMVVSAASFRPLSNKNISSNEAESGENSNKQWLDLVAVEVKSISHCTSLLKNSADQSLVSNGFTLPQNNIGEIQSLLCQLMCNIARLYFSKKSSGVSSMDEMEQKPQHCFVDAAIAFCKLQHLDVAVPTKTQVDLVVGIHDLLAEYGLCCVDDEGGVDGTFLKLAIKHLLALDVKLKSSSHSLNEGAETTSHVQGSISTTLEIPSEITVEDISTSQNPEQGKLEAHIDSGHDPLDVKMREERERSDDKVSEDNTELSEDQREELELAIDNALDQCFFCLYGLNLRSDSLYEDDLAMHRNTSRADYQSKEQCADVFKYILPYAKASTKTGLAKLRRVLRAIHKHFPEPPEDVLVGNCIDKFLDDPYLCEDKLSEDAGSDGFLEFIMKTVFPDLDILKQSKTSTLSCELYLEVYSNLYYLLANSEEMSASDKWPGFVLTKEGEDFVQQSANLLKYDLLFNPLRFESWQRLANVFDEEVDLLLNDGSKHVNVAGWRKNTSLSERVETSRRRSRRCLLMSLALAKTSDEQGEIHELLALVYYDGVQNVVPLYDQRSVSPTKDGIWMIFCQNSMKHFQRAFAQKQDWSHAYYLGKLSEKLGHSPESSFSYYDKAIALNPSAVDPVYRIHASRLKLLYTCNRQDLQTLKVAAGYSFDQSTKEAAINVLDGMSLDKTPIQEDDKGLSSQANIDEQKLEKSRLLDNVWEMLYSDCLSALEICIEGDLKHFHKARYMLAQGYYKRGRSGDLDKAKEELSFCFKSSRSSFTYNMWEIDGMIKKGKRKTPGVAGNKRALEVNLSESSRKFITCIRKYLLFYLRLLEESGDTSTLDRAYISIRSDKRFSLCLEDMVPVALGRYLKGLILSMQSIPSCSLPVAGRNNPEQILEKMFSLFIEQGCNWPDICSLPEMVCPELSESSLYGYLHQHIYSLETNAKLDVLEGINEKIRKRFKNPKLSNSNCARVCKHASMAWCRTLIINLSSITPLPLEASTESQPSNPIESDLECSQLLCVDLQTSELWSSSFGYPTHHTSLETKWNALLSKIKNVIIKKVSEENTEAATSLLRSAYSFYRDSSSVVLSSGGVNLYWIPARYAASVSFQPGSEGIALDVSITRKLLLWAYTLLHGRCSGISHAVKYCEENAKTRVKKGAGSSSIPTTASTSVPTIPISQPVIAGGNGSKDGGSISLETATPLPDEGNKQDVTNPVLQSGESQKILPVASQLQHCTSVAVVERTSFDLNDDASNMEET